MFDNIAVAGVSLMFVVLGLVQWLKEAFTIEGKAVKIASMIVGVLLGIGYQVTIAVPVTFAGWFGIVVFGLGVGLAASGIYDVNTNKYFD